MHLKTQTPQNLDVKEGKKGHDCCNVYKCIHLTKLYDGKSLKYRTDNYQYTLFTDDLIRYPSCICAVELAQMLQKPA